VVYTAGIGTCVASSSASFVISKFYSAAITGTIPPLCVTSIPVNLKSIVANTINGTWHGPNSSIVSTYSFSPQGFLTGVYTLTYNTTSSPDPLICPDESTIAVSILNPTVPSITMVGPYCSKASPVQMSVTPNVGHWVVMPYLNANGLFSPSLCSVGGNPVQYIVGTSTCNVQQTKFINVEAYVSSTIINKIPDQCVSNSAFNLSPITLNNTGKWGGTGILAGNFVPTLSGAGTFVLSYSTSTSPSGLCPESSTVAVNVYSLATPIIEQVNPLCTNSPVKQLIVSPLGGIFSGGNSGIVNNKGLITPAFGNLGNNIITYSISAGPCIAFAQTTVWVEKFISAEFISPQKINLCQNDLPINMESYVANPGGIWGANPNEAIAPGSSMFNPASAAFGDNEVRYETGSALCRDSKTIAVNVSPTPSISLVRDNISASCAPVSINFEMKSTGPENISGYGYWSIGDGSNIQDGLKISHTFTAAGVYSVMSGFVTDKGCKTQALLYPQITIYETPKASFVSEPDEITVANPEVYLNNTSSNISSNKYQWTITGQNQSFELNPVVTLATPGVYKITLSATSINGCKDQTSKLIEVKDVFNVFIPNTFSPNHDGLNDIFKPVFSPYGLDKTSYDFTIIDRWGQTVFRTTNPDEGWKGSGFKTEIYPIKKDEYIYQIRFKDLSGKTYYKTGSVFLISE
jgi:gliding motility-associated-like protein